MSTRSARQQMTVLRQSLFKMRLFCRHIGNYSPVWRAVHCRVRAYQITIMPRTWYANGDYCRCRSEEYTTYDDDIKAGCYKFAAIEVVWDKGSSMRNGHASLFCAFTRPSTTICETKQKKKVADGSIWNRGRGLPHYLQSASLSRAINN